DSKAAAKHAAAAKAAEDRADRETAISELRRAVAADPESAQNLFDLAYRLDLAGEEDEAIAMYERAVETKPAPMNALINLAILYGDRGGPARAERCPPQAIETAPNHPRARLFMKDVLASREMHVEEVEDRDAMKKKAMLDTPVTDFELSVRARTCLKKMNIR